MNFFLARISKSPSLSAFLALSLLAALDLAMLGGALWQDGKRVLGAPDTDMFAQFAAWRAFGFSEIARGHFPLWNPYVYCGAPYFGGVQAALLYLPNVIFLALPLGVALNWSYALHLWLLGALMFAWGRVRGLGAAAAFFGGALMMFGGTVAPHIYAGHPPNICTMAWAPAILCAIDGWIERRRAAWLLAGAGAVAMQVFAGHPQYVYYTAIAAGFYALLRWIGSDRNRWTAAGLLAIYPVGAALSAVQLFTAIQASAETVRHAPLPLEFASMFAFPPENFLTLAIPSIFGTLDQYWGRWYLWEMSMFCGVTACAAAVHAALGGGWRKTWPLWAALALSLLIALGKHTPLFALLYHIAPGFNKFRGVSKFIFPASLFLSMLAASGMESWLRGGGEIEGGRRGQEEHLPSRGLIAATGAFALAALAGGIWARATSLATWSQLIETMLRTNETYLRPSLLIDESFLLRAQQGAASAFLIASGAAAAATIFLILLRRKWRGAAWALLALGVAEVFLFARGTLATFELDTIAPPDLRREAAQWPAAIRIFNTTNPNSSMMLGVGDIWGSDPSVVDRYAQFIAWTQGQDPNRATQNVTFRAFDGIHPLFALLRLKY